MIRLDRLTPRQWLMLLLGLAFFYFYSGGGPNQWSRLSLDRAVLEQHRLEVDSYNANGEDKAYHRGHYYCDKAPGTSLFALAPLAAARTVMRFVGIDPNSAQGVSAQMHAATRCAATLPALLLCFLVFEWCLRCGYSRPASAYVTLALGLSSPMWAYATLFWGNALCACSLVLAMRAVIRVVQDPFGEKAELVAGVGGIGAGWSVITEFPAAPMAVALLLVMLTRLWPWPMHFSKLAAFVAGAALPALVLGTYNALAFGSPFHLGYASVQGFEGMKRGVFGVTIPSMEAVAGVIWGPRSLLLTAPLLLFGISGHGLWLLRGRDRLQGLLSLAFCVYPVLLNVSYVYWDGGWTYGPRHSSVALPFMAMGLAPWFKEIPPRLRVVATAGLAGSIFLTMIAVATHGMTPSDAKSPFLNLYWSAFLNGRYARHVGWIDIGGPATNLGLALGLDRAHSLIPLWFGMAFCLLGLTYSLHNRRL